MERIKKISFYFISIFMIFFSVSIFAYAQTQDVSLDPAASSQNPGEEFSLSVWYSTTPENKTVTGVGVDFFFDSTKLDFKGFENVFEKNLFASESVPQPDAADADSDADTDSIVKLTWTDFTAQWPGGDAVFPLKLVELKFEVLSGSGGVDTPVNIVASGTASGYDPNFTGATVTVVPSQYTVTFEDHDGTVLKTEQVDSGGSATPPQDPVREGYTFTGWNPPPPYDNVTEDLTVVAQYEATTDTFTVTFQDYDGTVLKTEEVAEGSAATAPAEPVRDGYMFTGWDPAFDNVTEDFTVVAQYEAITDTFTVTFQDYDGTVLKTEDVEEGSAATAPDYPEREGFTFTGWDVPFDNITSDLVVIAQYSVAVYTLTYTPNPVEGGSITGGDAVQEVEYGEDGTTVTAVPSEGYEFVQWSDGLTDNPRTDTNVTEDITVTAQFDMINKVATPVFVPDGGFWPEEESLEVTVTCATEGATITYTTDGENPTESDSEVVGGVVTVSIPGVLKAKAWKEGMTPSDVKTAIYQHGMPDGVGLYDQKSATFYLANALQAGPGDREFRFGFRDNNLIPVAGDWDGDEKDGIGLYHQEEGRFFLSDALEAGSANIDFRFGPRSNNWIPVAGDWDGDGVDGIGLYDQEEGRFFLSDALEAGSANIDFRFGPRDNNWIPVVGDWDGDGVDGIGLYDQEEGRFFLSDALEAGLAAMDFRFGPRGNNWVPIPGKWPLFNVF
ncbi:MAG: InlB B-repeat-containing protein [Desulfatiglandaceae bacterium]